jgi:hypothetical protein
VKDAAGNNHQVSYITVEGEFHKVISAIPLERAGYESAAVLHGLHKVLN